MIYSRPVNLDGSWYHWHDPQKLFEIIPGAELVRAGNRNLNSKTVDASVGTGIPVVYKFVTGAQYGYVS